MDGDAAADRDYEFAPELTENEARELITQLVGRAAITLAPFEYGWIAVEILTPDELDQGMNVGQPLFLIDRTGVVTVHPSLPRSMVLEEYNAARRAGRIAGRRVWPMG